MYVMCICMYVYNYLPTYIHMVDGPKPLTCLALNLTLNLAMSPVLTPHHEPEPEPGAA